MSHFHADVYLEFCHTLWSGIIFTHFTDKKSEMQKSSETFLNNTNQVSRLCGTLIQIYYFLLLPRYFK